MIVVFFFNFSRGSWLLWLSKYMLFFNRPNIINQQARARSTNKLGWRKKNTKGNRLPKSHRLEQKPLKNHPKPKEQTSGLEQPKQKTLLPCYKNEAENDPKVNPKRNDTKIYE